MTGSQASTQTPGEGAASSRQRLLDAAVTLFAERGYDRATARDIGARAGVDPAMIARYFGGKAQLYIAALQVEVGDSFHVDLLDPDRMAGLLERTTHTHPSPIFQVAVRPHDDPAGQQATTAELHRQVVTPLETRLQTDGVDDADLRAEVITAAFAGVMLARTSGAFRLLPEASNETLQSILLEMLTPAR